MGECPIRPRPKVRAIHSPRRLRASTPHPPQEPNSKHGDVPERYAEREVLGRGGMGDIRLFDDTMIGRAVAIKTLRRISTVGVRDRERFVREALVQARLEHPSIVPVYDLGAPEAGDAFFTMRRVPERPSLRSSKDSSKATKPSRRNSLATVCSQRSFGCVKRLITPTAKG